MTLNIGVIGAGSMGTALSQSIAENVDNLYLYARNKEICNEINNSHYNSRYYPNIKLKENIIAINDFDKLNTATAVFLCVPSSVIRDTTIKLSKVIAKDCIIVTTAKGIEKNTTKRMSEIIEEITNKPAVSLSGPNIASEMAKNMLTATTISCSVDKNLKTIKKILESSQFKVNVNNDVIGTELCGIVKNVIAISQGICEGLNINNNARFALFTKSYSETKALIEQFGGNKNTVDDYCGFGDIVTASTLSVSRNHTLGVLYGQNIKIDEKTSGVLFEGINTTKILKKMCERNNINSPTINFVYEVIVKKENPKLAFKKFWETI